MEMGRDEVSTFEVKVMGIQPNDKRGQCPFGHKVGDRYEFGLGTPGGLCGEAFCRMFPILHGLRMGGDLRTLDADAPDRVMHWCPTRIVQFEIIADRQASSATGESVVQQVEPVEQPADAAPSETPHYGRRRRQVPGRRR
jgi:uncharacterized repeat protein (TIGR04076 family)